MNTVKFNRWFNRNWENLVTNEILDKEDYRQEQALKVWEYMAEQKGFPIEKTRELFHAWYVLEKTDRFLNGSSLHTQCEHAWIAAEKAMSGK